MKKILILLLALFASHISLFNFQLSVLVAQDTLWVRYDDRFRANQFVSLQNVDSIVFRSQQLRFHSNTTALGYTSKTSKDFAPTDAADMQFTDPGRYLLKPDTYGGTDYTNAAATSGYNFAHSLESDHFAVFWDARFGDNPKHIKHPDNGSVANAYDVLDVCERCWTKYVQLGFVVPGKSTTDKWKVQLYIPYQSEWRADASGTGGVGGGKTGIGHFNPWAATARGGHTIAHEVGHTFQYLTSADLGMNHGLNYGYGAGASGGNGWWESCANWQAYKVFP